jgi:hypothetical protein
LLLAAIGALRGELAVHLPIGLNQYFSIGLDGMMYLPFLGYAQAEGRACRNTSYRGTTEEGRVKDKVESVVNRQ